MIDPIIILHYNETKCYLLITTKKNVRDQKKQKDAQSWDSYIKSNTDHKTNSIQSCTELKHEQFYVVKAR